MNTRRPITADAIAEELETSKRTVYRDIADLMAQRVPIRGEAGVGYLLRPSYTLPPLQFTAEEVEERMTKDGPLLALRLVRRDVLIDHCDAALAALVVTFSLQAQIAQFGFQGTLLSRICHSTAFQFGQVLTLLEQLCLPILQLGESDIAGGLQLLVALGRRFGQRHPALLQINLQRGLLQLRCQSGDASSCSLLSFAGLQRLLLALDAEIGPLAKIGTELTNARWGLLTRAGNDKSHLTRQIERYADIYTSRVSNFLYATPYAYFRSPRGNLPHDPVGNP